MLQEWLTRTWLRIKALAKRKQHDRDLEEELQFHLAKREEKFAASGSGVREAHYAARRSIGNANSVREVTREMWTFNWLEDFWQDLRYGARMLRKNPGFTATAILTLALGIGANTAIFSVVNAVLLRPLPYRDSARLYWISDFVPQFNGTLVGSSDFLAWREQNTVFEEMAAYNDSANNLTGDGDPERAAVSGITANFFPLLGVTPAIGRDFVDEEDRAGGPPVAILGHHLWELRYGGDPRILDRSVQVDNHAYRVVGVMSPDFRFPDNDVSPDLFVPLKLPAKPDWSPQTPQQIVSVLGRVKPGTHSDRVLAELKIMNRQIAKQYPAEIAGIASSVEVRLVNLHDKLAGDTRADLLILLGAVSLLLLISCANVANLQLARSSVRLREFSVRMALGAGKFRLVRQLITENVLLAVISAGFGLFVARERIQLFRAIAPPGIPHPEMVVMDNRVLGFTVLVAVFTGILFGLAPVFATFHTDLNQPLKEGHGSSGTTPARVRLRGVLMVCELAMALMVMASAGLLISSFVRLMDVSPGFDARNLLVAQIKLSSINYGKREQQIAFVARLVDAAKGLPGVKMAAVGNSLPMMVYDTKSVIRVMGQAQAPSRVLPMFPVIAASADYFRTLGIPQLEGRAFDARDGADAPGVAIINRAFATQYVGNANPLGQSIRMGGGPDPPWMQIVGVVGDERHEGLETDAPPQVYVPLDQSRLQYIQVALRTESDPAGVASELKHAVSQLDPNLPVYDVSTMEQRLSNSMSARRFDMLMLGIFAAVALIVAGIGVYGVVSYATSQRVHEFGIRVALGAGPADLVRLVLKHGMRLTSIGVVVGIVGALGVTRLLKSLLFEIKPTDPLTLVIVAALLAAVALLACYIPARRAMRVDPMVALRHE
ncbi:MAG TPA: ABC transporter permease [Candidatus Limnocylindrales bacterium]|nr:ABC transporter permease [Candidatus Limnocylindrales bacterium]